MIITSGIKLEPNKYYTDKDFSEPFDNVGEIITKFKFLVIRECTLQEYRNSLNKTYPEHIAIQIINYEYFYEIHTD